MTNYQRQSEINLHTPEKIAVVGCGGAGSWVALFSAMQGVEEIQLYDDDEIEDHNLNRIPYSKKYIGEKKVDALEDLIVNLREETVIYKYPKVRENGFTLQELKKVDVIYCATDTLDSQKLLKDFAEEHNIVFHKLGYDGSHITLSQSVNSWGEADPEEGYEITPSWVVPPALVALLAVSAESKMFDYGTISRDLTELLAEIN